VKTLAVVAIVAAACGGAPPSLPPPQLPPVGTDVAPPPMPPPPNEIAKTVDGEVTDATVHGVRVLIKRTRGTEAVSTGLYFTGGAMVRTKDNAGLEQLALAVATEGGTKTLDKDAFAKRLAELGSSIYSTSTRDYASIIAWSLAPAWDDTFAILAQTLREPALPDTQVEIERGQQLAQIAHNLDVPDARLSLMVAAGAYKGHPYEVEPIGTTDGVKAFTRDQIVQELAALRQTSRMLLVVVGDVDADHVLGAVQRAFGDLPKGDYQERALPELPANPAGIVELVSDKLPTSYVEAIVPGPRWNDPDFAVARVAMTWLHQAEFEAVRTKRNLSYAPAAGFAWTAMAPVAYLYVTAVDPKTTMAVMLDEAKKLRDAKVADRDLAAAKALLLTATFVNGEAPADQGSLLAEAQIAGGDWHFVRNLPKLVAAVTADQVQAWCSKHLTHFHTFVIGDGTKLDRASLERF
jgi:zinc protease